MESTYLLPQSTIVKILKRALAEYKDADATAMGINKAAKLALSNAASTFLLYVVSAANDACVARKRQNIALSDVFQ